MKRYEWPAFVVLETDDDEEGAGDAAMSALAAINKGEGVRVFLDGEPVVWEADA